MAKKKLLESLISEWQTDCDTLMKEIENISIQFKCLDEISSNLQKHVSSVLFEIKKEPILENKVNTAVIALGEVKQYVRSEASRRSSIVHYKKGQFSILTDNIQKIKMHEKNTIEEQKRKERILKKVNDGVDLSKRPLGERPEKLKDIRNVKSESSLNVNKTNKDS